MNQSWKLLIRNNNLLKYLINDKLWLYHHYFAWFLIIGMYLFIIHIDIMIKEKQLLIPYQKYLNLEL
ncbi:hypothetical protein pb186bvf_013270 [Paramecium bursaria]